MDDLVYLEWDVGGAREQGEVFSPDAFVPQAVAFGEADERVSEEDADEQIDVAILDVVRLIYQVPRQARVGIQVQLEDEVFDDITQVAAVHHHEQTNHREHGDDALEYLECRYGADSSTVRVGDSGHDRRG